MGFLNVALICACPSLMANAGRSGQSSACEDCEERASNVTTSLLQMVSHAAQGLTQPAADPNSLDVSNSFFSSCSAGSSSFGKQKAHMVGRTVDGTTMDFFKLRNIHYETFFTGMPEGCVKVYSCPNSEDSEKESFESNYEFQTSYLTNFGVKVGASYAGFGGKVHASMGNTDDSTESSFQKSTWWKRSKVRCCTQIEGSCLRQKVYLDPIIAEKMETLMARDREMMRAKSEQMGRSVDVLEDAETMNSWLRGFIQPYGTHVVMAVSHGAAIQALHTVDKSCQASNKCRQLAGGLKFKFTEPTGLFGDLIPKAQLQATIAHCANSSVCLNEGKGSCFALGGNGGGGKSLCGSDVTADDVNNFLSSGNMGEASSIISMNLKAIDEVIAGFADYGEHSKQLRKAVDYALCQPPAGEWIPDPTDPLGDRYICWCRLQCDGCCTDACTSHVCPTGYAKRYGRVTDAIHDADKDAICCRPLLAPGSIVALIGSRESKYCQDWKNWNGWIGIKCNKDSIDGSWEKFEVVSAGDGKIALKGGRGNKFCTDRRDDIMSCDASSIGPFNKFDVVEVDDDRIALKSAGSNKYCTNQQDDFIKCQASQAGVYESFKVVCRGGECAKTRNPTPSPTIWSLNGPPTPPTTPPTTVLSFTFQPGDEIGINAEWISGMITTVGLESQADQQGVLPGMTMLRVGSSPYSQQIYLSAKAGSSSFQVTMASILDFSCTFQPGVLGFYLDSDNDARISEVVAGQAKNQGVKDGFLFLTVGGQPYTKARLDAAKAGTTSYLVTFAAVLPPPVEDGAIFSGTYTCGGTRTNLKIYFIEWPAAQFEYEFPGCKGLFWLRGIWTAGSEQLTFEPGDWERKSCGDVVRVGLTGTLTNGARYSGAVTNDEGNCQSFDTSKIR